MTEWHGEEGQTNQDELVHNASLGVVSKGNESLGLPRKLFCAAKDDRIQCTDVSTFNVNLTCLTEKGLIPQQSVLVWCRRCAAAVFQAGLPGGWPLEILPPGPEKW